MNNLIDTLAKKTQWLAKNAQVKANNIGKSQVPEAQKQELMPFAEVMSYSQKSSRLNIPSNAIQRTGEEIAVDWEAFELTQTTMDHQATIALIKKYLTMVRNVIGK